MHILILQAASEPITTFTLDKLDKLGSPALVLLIMVLVGVIYYFMKQIKLLNLKIAEKEVHIQELNNAAMEGAVKNLAIIHDISTTIDKSDDRGRVLESLLVENNSFLKTILRSLNI